MRDKAFYLSFLSILFLNVSASADTLDRFVESKPYQEFGGKGHNIPPIAKEKWVIPEGTYGSLFASIDSIKQIHDWLTTKSALFLSKEKTKSMIGNTYFLQQVYVLDGHAPLRVEIYVPHPKNLEEARYGLLKAYRALTPKVMNVDVQEKVKVQGYDAILYELKDKSCRVLINMPHEIRVYLIGQCNDLDVIYKLGEELSLTRLESKLDN